MPKQSTPKTQTIKETREPWIGARPGLSLAINAAQDQFRRGPQSYFPNNTVAPFSADTLSAQNSIRQNAPQAGMFGGMGLERLNTMASGAGTPANIAAMASGTNTNPFLAGLQTMSQGGQNPYLDAMFNQGAGRIRNQVDSAFARAGRAPGGSVNYADTLTRGLGDFATSLYGNAFDAGESRRLGAMQSGAGVAANDSDRALQAFLGVGGQQLSALDRMPALYDFSNAGARDLAGIGNQVDTREQALINSDVDKWNFEQNAPWDNIARLNSIATGQGGLGGTSTSQQPYQPGNPFMQAAGNVAAVASIAKMLPAIMSAFSDRRLKTDIAHVANDRDGLPWYSFRYLWDRPDTERLGVMADEAKRVKPRAVKRHASGFDVVDYRELAEAA